MKSGHDYYLSIVKTFGVIYERGIGGGGCADFNFMAGELGTVLQSQPRRSMRFSPTIVWS